MEKFFKLMSLSKNGKVDKMFISYLMIVIVMYKGNTRKCPGKVVLPS